MKIAVCVPHTGTVKGRFAQCLADMVAHTLSVPIVYNGQSTRPLLQTIFADEGSIDLKRTRLALAALKSEADYVLWLDADHTFPPTALLALMQHDRPIVGCNYPTRQPLAVARPTAMTDDLPVPTTAEKAEARLVEEVHAIGFGLCLMKGLVLAKVPHPWFQTSVSANGDLACGEDVHFCNQARSASIPIFVDHGLSWIVGHINDSPVSLGDLAPSLSDESDSRLAHASQGGKYGIP